MTTCPDCKGPMKPLFTGMYCVLECDLPDSKFNQLNKKIAEAQGLAAKPAVWAPYGGSWAFGAFYPTPTPSSYVPGKGQCPKAMCRGRGTLQYSSFTTNQQNVVTGRDHYQCSICNHQYDEVNNSGIPSTIP